MIELNNILGKSSIPGQTKPVGASADKSLSDDGIIFGLPLFSIIIIAVGILVIIVLAIVGIIFREEIMDILTGGSDDGSDADTPAPVEKDKADGFIF